MNRVRIVLGFIAGALLVLSSAAHSFLGWKEMGAQLASTNAPADLVQGLRMGWLWGGVAMLTLGVVVLLLFACRLRGNDVPMFPAAIISIAYLLFGVWAFLSSSFDPFFLVFIIPGALLAVASIGGRT